MQKTMSFNNVAIVFVKENVYRINLWYVSKDEPMNFIRNTDLIEKNETL